MSGPDGAPARSDPGRVWEEQFLDALAEESQPWTVRVTRYLVACGAGSMVVGGCALAILAFADQAFDLVATALTAGLFFAVVFYGAMRAVLRAEDEPRRGPRMPRAALLRRVGFLSACEAAFIGFSATGGGSALFAAGILAGGVAATATGLVQLWRERSVDALVFVQVNLLFPGRFVRSAAEQLPPKARADGG